MTKGMLFYSGIALFSASLILMALLIFISVKQKKASNYVTLKHSQSKKEGHLLWWYRIFSRNILTRRSIFHIRSRFELVANASEKAIRLKVMKVYVFIVSLLVLVFGLVVIISRNLWIIILWTCILWIISETLVDFMVVRLKNRLLWQQIKFNERVRHRYYQSGMVDEAIYETCSELDKDYYEIALQGERMIDVLMSVDPEHGMLAYNEVAPNKYLKMFLSLAYMTMEYGDAKVDGVSVFMKNLHDLNNELQIELSKRERLNYALRSLNVIVLLPLLMIGPIKNWASSYFMPLKLFYDSQTGFVLEIVMVTMILICYVLLRRVQQFDYAKQTYSRKVAIEDRLYGRGWAKIVDYLKPKVTTSKYRKLKNQLKMTASNLSVEGFVVRRIASGLILALACLGLVLFLHYNARARILVAPTIDENFLGGQLSEEELEKAASITERDTGYLKRMDKATSLEEIQEMVMADGVTKDQAKVIADQIRVKQVDFYGHNLKLWECLLILGLSLLGYQVPMWFLLFRGRLLKMEIEDEVTGFGTIVLMLMHHERLTITDILEWFEIYSVAFSEAIGDCLNNISSGMTEALIELRGASEQDQFVRLIEGLILASEDITISQAFDELDTEKMHHFEQRKENNRRIVEKKVNLGNTIGFLPVYGLIVLYMIIPMVMIGMQDMSKYFEQLSM